MASRNPSKQRKKSKHKRSSSRPQSPTPSTPDQTSDRLASDVNSGGSESSLRPTPGYIPEEVSQRMLRRVALFCGIPSFLGLGSFVLNYFLITGDVVDLPAYFTLVETLVFFGLGFVGISYGVLSASWEPYPGSALGVSEFRTNLGNMIQQWRDYSAQKRSASKTNPDTTETED